MEQMRLLGLDDKVGEIDAGSIAIDQIAALVKTVPASKWGDAAKALPQDFVKEICKQGAVDSAGSALSEYGPSLGVGLLAGAGVASFSKNVALSVAAAAASGLVFYLVTRPGSSANA